MVALRFASQTRLASQADGPGRERDDFRAHELVALLASLIEVRDPDAVPAVPWAVHPNEGGMGIADVDFLAVPGTAVKAHRDHPLLRHMARDLRVNGGHTPPRDPNVRLTDFGGFHFLTD